MIRNLSREDFVKVLHAHLSPASPIQSTEHLFGREKQLQQIEQALCAPGRSIFIYGERGVGKTSLAHTVAFSQQSAFRNPVLLFCTPKTTFEGLMADALAALNGQQTVRNTTTYTGKLGWKGIGLEGSRTHTAEVVPRIQAVAWDLNIIVTSFLEVGEARKDKNDIVVIDEFDRIQNDEERGHFADFIKQVGDQRVPVKFVFCGVAESMQKLLGAHGSCYRYLDEIELSTLGYEARFDIIDSAAKALGVSVDDRPRYRIAAISDGFPHYIHRMCEQLFWQMFNDPVACTTPTHDHYRQAVAQSVLNIEQHLRTTYDRAVMKDAPGYEQVLWAVADHADFIRNTESIYDSYIHVMRSAEGADVLDRQTVVARLNALKGTSCGSVLSSARKGWYQFREGIMRGYVRLRAEELGCELALDYSAATSSNAALTWRPRGARRGKTGTTTRDWEQLRKDPS